VISVKDQIQEDKKIFKLLQRIVVMEENGQYQKALCLCDEILKIDDENFDAVHYKALLFYHFNDLKKALSYCRKAHRLDPTNYQVLESMATMLILLNRFEESQYFLQKAAQLEGGEYSISKIFRFTNCNIVLEIMDPLTMLTHHIWIWDAVNTSSRLLNSITYDIQGDIPRSLSDLKIRVFSNKYGKLKIIPRLDLPEHKTLFAFFPENVPPHENQNIAFEFDWEEPDRYYIWRLVTICDNFQYTIYFQNKFDFEPKFSLIDTETGDKIVQNYSYEIEKLASKTKVVWKFKNPDQKFLFRVDW